MEIIVNYPKSEDGINELNMQIGYFHAFLIFKAIENLDVDNISKRKIFNFLVNNIQDY